MRACLSQVVLPEARTFHTDPRSGQIDCPFVIGLTAMDHRALAPNPSFASIRERSGYLALQFSNAGNAARFVVRGSGCRNHQGPITLEVKRETPFRLAGASGAVPHDATAPREQKMTRSSAARHVALATHPWAIVRHGCAVPNNPRGWAGGTPRPWGFGTAQPCRTPRKLKNVRRITAGRAGRPQFARERLPPFERVIFSACGKLTFSFFRSHT